MTRTRFAFFSAVLLSCALASNAQQETEQTKPIDSFTRARLHDMFHQTVREVRANYYDPKFHGVDLDAGLAKYDAIIDKVATQGEGFRAIAAFLAQFHDSHLFFITPPRPYRYDSGYRTQMIGDNEFVTQVRPGTDAAEKLSPGDRVVHFNGFRVDRATEPNMMYYFHLLAPSPAVKFDLSSPDGKSSSVIVQSRMIARPLSVNLDSDEIYQIIRDEEGDIHRYRDRIAEVGDVMIWKMAEFSDNNVDGLIKRANQHSALILDLRGNPGGAVTTLKSVLGHLFDHDVKMYDEVSRKQTKAEIAKSVGTHAFKGKLIVLVDSGSASCSEVTSRVIQLEHRGTILGDLSAGALMESMQYREQVGGDVMVVYALSITHANLIMTDGKSVEKVGVMPDERILPSPDDLYNHKDPVLARAVELAGGHIDPAAAGKLFTYEWPSL